VDFAIPTSIRRIDEKLDRDIEASLDSTSDAEVQICHIVYHITRLTARLGTHGIMVCKMAEDLMNGGDLDYAPFIIGNLISTGYEVFNLIKGRWKKIS